MTTTTTMSMEAETETAFATYQLHPSIGLELAFPLKKLTKKEVELIKRFNEKHSDEHGDFLACVDNIINDTASDDAKAHFNEKFAKPLHKESRKTKGWYTVVDNENRLRKDPFRLTEPYYFFTYLPLLKAELERFKRALCPTIRLLEADVIHREKCFILCLKDLVNKQDVCLFYDPRKDKEMTKTMKAIQKNSRGVSKLPNTEMRGTPVSDTGNELGWAKVKPGTTAHLFRDTNIQLSDSVMGLLQQGSWFRALLAYLLTKHGYGTLRDAGTEYYFLGTQELLEQPPHTDYDLRSIMNKRIVRQINRSNKRQKKDTSRGDPGDDVPRFPWSCDIPLTADGLALNVWYDKDMEKKKKLAKEGMLKQDDFVKPIRIEAQMNQVLLWDGSLIHGGGFDGIQTKAPALTTDTPVDGELKPIRSFRVHMALFLHGEQSAFLAQNDTKETYRKDDNGTSFSKYCWFDRYQT